MLNLIQNRAARWCLLAASLAAASASVARAEHWKLWMDADPDLSPVVLVPAILPQMVRAWSAALEHEGDRELTMAAASDVVRAATAGGEVADLAEPLKSAFSRETRLAVQSNLARALLELGDYSLADQFVQLGATDVNFAAATYPTLVANGKLPPDQWRPTLEDNTASLRRRRLAFRCAGLARDADAFEPLRRVAMDVRQPLRLRLAAAENAALASEEHDDPIQDAELAIEREGEVGKMLAVRLLAAAHQEASADPLLRLALDPNLAVTSVACQRLAERWPDRLLGIADQLADHPAPKSRLITVHCAIKHGGKRAPQLLGLFIADDHLDVRAAAGSGLVDLATAAGEGAPIFEGVQDVVRATLQADRWQGHAQAALVSDALADVTICDMMLDVLNRPEERSREAAAYFLGRHLPKERVGLLHQHFQSVVESSGNPLEATLVMQAFGRTAYAPAEPDLAPFVPKSMSEPASVRAAAVWCLGKIHEGKATKKWSDAFIERVEDVTSLSPELDVVRKMAAVSLGRMNSREHLLRLAAMGPSQESRMGQSLLWAMRKLSDEPVLAPAMRFPVKTDFFILSIMSREELAQAKADSDGKDAQSEGLKRSNQSEQP